MGRNRYQVDETLIRRFMEGFDSETEAILDFETHERTMEFVRLMRPWKKSGSDTAEEQIAFTVTAKKLRRIREGGFDPHSGRGNTADTNYSAWVRANTKFACLDAQFREQALISLSENSQDEDTPDFQEVRAGELGRVVRDLGVGQVAAEREEAMRALEACLNGLSGDQFAFMNTRYFLREDAEGLPTIGEVADFLGWKSAKANTVFHRAKKAMEKCLRARGVVSGVLPEVGPTPPPPPRRASRMRRSSS